MMAELQHFFLGGLQSLAKSCPRERGQHEEALSICLLRCFVFQSSTFKKRAFENSQHVNWRPRSPIPVSPSASKIKAADNLCRY